MKSDIALMKLFLLTKKAQLFLPGCQWQKNCLRCFFQTAISPECPQCFLRNIFLVLFLAEHTYLFISCFISISNLVFLVYGKEMFSSLVPDSVPCMSRFLSRGDQNMAGDDENPDVVLIGSWDAAGSFAQLQSFQMELLGMGIIQSGLCQSAISL